MQDPHNFYSTACEFCPTFKVVYVTFCLMSLNCTDLHPFFQKKFPVIKTSDSILNWVFYEPDSCVVNNIVLHIYFLVHVNCLCMDVHKMFFVH